MDVWVWICELPNSSQWTESPGSSLAFELASSSSTRSIQLRAERTNSGSDEDPLVTFTVRLEGFGHVSGEDVLWTSDACQLSSEKPFLPLVLQLLQEIISRSPTAHDSSGTCPRSRLQRLKPDVVSWIMDSHSPESFAAFFGLVLLTRLFWLCACDAPAEVGSLFFGSLLGPSLEPCLAGSPALRTFFTTVGVDAEIRFVRAVGYMLAKWCISKDTGAGVGLLQVLATSPSSPPPPKSLGFSYSKEAHGFWTLKGYAPVSGMRVTRRSNSADKSRTIASQFPSFGKITDDLVLKYALAHQQLEAVIQLEYTVGFYEGLIQVNARVDNIRLHVPKLGYGKGGGSHDEEAEAFSEERHFPSRVRLWVGPEVGANYVGGLSLGRSTSSGESREVETQRVVKGSFSGKSSPGQVKAKARTSSRTRQRSWRWDQDAEGNAAVFEAVLCDRATGREVAGGDGGVGFRDRYGGAERVFTKSGGVVLAGDEYGEGVGWRLSKEMEGSVLKWRIGGKVWLSYCPNQVKTSSFCETRCVEWCDEVDLPLIPAKLVTF